MECIVVGGGTEPESVLLTEYVKNDTMVIGADLGCKVLLHNNIIPHYIVGDFDTVNSGVIESLVNKGTIKIAYNPEKDCTDSKIAFDLALQKQADKITLLGMTGTRFDHTFANVGLLLRGLKEGVDVELVDNNNIITLIDTSKVLKRKLGYKYISFLAYGKNVSHLNISNAKYNLKNYNLDVGDGITVSNEFISDQMEVSFEEGNLLVIYSKD